MLFFPYFSVFSWVAGGVLAFSVKIFFYYYFKFFWRCLRRGGEGVELRVCDRASEEDFQLGLEGLVSSYDANPFLVKDDLDVGA
ncbi:MAG: hypothetical protein FD143_2902 [Ignavibacteria bacterium]|nr:MAG: hypothetical protein FD143_2902 [Ignavibacteria bacterium]